MICIVTDQPLTWQEFIDQAKSRWKPYTLLTLLTISNVVMKPVPRPWSRDSHRQQCMKVPRGRDTDAFMSLATNSTCMCVWSCFLYTFQQSDDLCGSLMICAPCCRRKCITDPPYLIISSLDVILKVSKLFKPWTEGQWIYILCRDMIQVNTSWDLKWYLSAERDIQLRLLALSQSPMRPSSRSLGGTAEPCACPFYHLPKHNKWHLNISRMISVLTPMYSS